MNLGPYVAIIRDSFHAALSSRVLWVAMVAIWLVLAMLAPFGVREDFTTKFQGRDFLNGTRMKIMLGEGLVDPAGDRSAVGRIARAMPDELKRKLQLVGQGEEIRISYSVLVDALNRLLDDDSWYDAEVWESTVRLRELRELDAAAAEQVTPSLRDRRTRLRIEAALPGVFATRSSRSILLTYAGIDFPSNWGWVVVEKPQFETLINQFVLPTLIDWLLGFALVLLGILVTASIIPDMLQPGSLHLLLSKPISRTLLLLSKFVGGLAFVFLCVVQLVVGLYLVAGWRLGIWNPRLLWCIPVSVFLFAVFYSVSVLAGLRWRSPILAISVTVIFGAINMVVGIIGGFFDTMVKDPYRLTHLAVAGDAIFGTTRGGGLVRYDAKLHRWMDIYESAPLFANFNRTLAPVALNDDQVITAYIQHGRINPFGSGAPELLLLGRQQNWEPEPSMRLPTATTQLFAAGDRSVLALTTGELSLTSHQQIFAATGLADDEAAAQAGAAPDRQADQRNRLNFSGIGGSLVSQLQQMIGLSAAGFSNVLPPQTSLTPPRSVAVDLDGEFIVACSGSRLIRLDRPTDPKVNSTTWKITCERFLRGDESKRFQLALSGERVLIVPPDGPCQLLDATTLMTLGRWNDNADELVSVHGLEPLDGQHRFLAVTEQSRCLMLASENDSPLPITGSVGPGNIECIHYDAASKRIVLAHAIDRMTVVDANTLKSIERIDPKRKAWRQIDAWVITPLRYLLPQTSELSQTISATISGKSTFSLGNGIDDDVRFQYRIVRPMVTCSVFILVMLITSCVYFSTRDF